MNLTQEEDLLEVRTWLEVALEATEKFQAAYEELRQWMSGIKQKELDDAANLVLHIMWKDQLRLEQQCLVLPA